MQTWITDYDFYKSASNLDSKSLHINICESIHILASLLNCNDKLVNPKKNVKNHPAAKLWKEYEKSLLVYILQHIQEWKFERKKKCPINEKNYYMLNKEIFNKAFFCDAAALGIKKQDESDKYWINDELIKIHRSVLIQKEKNKDEQLRKVRKILCIRRERVFGKNVIDRYNNQIKNYSYKIEKNYHYRKLWPNVPRDLKMRYDWRDKKCKQ